MYEACERYKDLLRRCPHHELPRWLQIQTFYNGLKNENRAMVSATAGGSLMRRTLEKAYDMLEDMALNAFNWKSKRLVKRPVGVHSIDSFSSLSAHIKALQKRTNNMNASAIQIQGVSYEF